MYQLIVEENGRRPVIGGKLFGAAPLAAQRCRISALSSADFCLRGREDMDWGKIAWRGNKQEILRLFEAERLDGSGLNRLEEHRDYRVLFLAAS